MLINCLFTYTQLTLRSLCVLRSLLRNSTKHNNVCSLYSLLTS